MSPVARTAHRWSSRTASAATRRCGGYVAPAFEADPPGGALRPPRRRRLGPAAYDAASHATLQGYADDVVRLLDALDLPPVVFVGHSVSAMIGALASAGAPERFAHLVMVGPSPRYIDDESYAGGFSEEEILELLDTMDANYLGWSAALAPGDHGRPERPELGAELTTSFCRADPAIARRFARATFLSDNRADLAKVATPSLVLQCRDDVIAPVAVGRYVHEQLPASTFALLDATGHCPNLSAPETVVDAIREYLEV